MHAKHTSPSQTFKTHQSIEQKLVHPPNLRAHGRRVPPGAEGPLLQVTARVQRLGPHLLLHVPASEEPVGRLLLGAPHPLAGYDVVERVGELGGVRFENVGVQEGGGGDGCRLVFFFFWASGAGGLGVGAVGVVFVGVVLDHSGCDECFVVGLGVA